MIVNWNLIDELKKYQLWILEIGPGCQTDMQIVK